MKLSIVDQCPVSQSQSPSQALHNSLELARLADRLGYTRYWVAEHHGIRHFASPAPEILLSRIAAETRWIRVGSGGILLPYYAPLKVAESFRMLEALSPGRIDLGIGRAPGGSPLEAHALIQGQSAAVSGNRFIDQVHDLAAFLQGDFPDNHPYQRIHVAPASESTPDLWLLGSSPWSAQAAAALGLPYAFAHFIDPTYSMSALQHHRTHAPQAHRILALGVVCADILEEARWHYNTTRLLGRRIRAGDRRPVAPPEEAQAILGLPGDPPAIQPSSPPRYLWGTPERVKAQLDAIAALLDLEEIMIVTIVHDHVARCRSYELLAKAYGIRPAAELGL